MAIYFSSDWHIGHKNILIFDPLRGEKFIDDPLGWGTEWWLSWAETEEQKSLDRDPYRNLMKESIVKHDDYIMSQIESLKETDDLYFLWDLFLLNGTSEIKKMSDRLSKVKCRMHWIVWNHDKDKHIELMKHNFEEVCHQKEIRYQKRKIIMSHYPYETWWGMHKTPPIIHLHWHTHQKALKTDPLWRLCVSYNWGQLLWDIDDILEGRQGSGTR